jgi:hypothetical protein
MVMGVMGACSENFLDRPPLSEVSSENFYQTSGDLRLATAALYAGAPWAEWLYSSYLPVGEVLSGNMVLGWNGDAAQFNSFSITGLNNGLIANWKGMYTVIAHCNATINGILQNAPSSIPNKDKQAAIAEAKFLRAYAYFNLVMLWREVPIIENNEDLIGKPQISRNLDKDVYQFIVNDLTFASKYLPETDAKGRLTTWSAQGLLSKVYLAWSGLNPISEGMRDQAKLDSAIHYAGNVCENSGLELLDNYAELFKKANNDNPESLFALQWSSESGGWFEGNMLQIYSSGGVEISANGSAGWFAIGPSYDIYKQYSEKDSVRRKATFMMKDDYYPELNAAGGGFTYTGTAGLKKHIIGTNVDNGSPKMSLTSSAEHNSLLRLADVYLVYADAIRGNNATTSDPRALTFFNKVRIRAGVDPVSVLNQDVILNERRLELAAEGHYWFDLVALSYYMPAKVIAMLNNQQRMGIKYEQDEFTPGDKSEITPATINTFRLPIPSSEITANPKLLDQAVPYF